MTPTNKRAIIILHEIQEAYDYFMNYVGLNVYKEISEFITQLKDNYEKVVVFGFSVGATVAWKCCENVSCDGIIACYGSHIIDDTNLDPVCPTLLLFAKEDSFDVDSVVNRLRDKPGLAICKLKATHGFMDPFTINFSRKASESAGRSISAFLSITKPQLI